MTIIIIHQSHEATIKVDNVPCKFVVRVTNLLRCVRRNCEKLPQYIFLLDGFDLFVFFGVVVSKRIHIQLQWHYRLNRNQKLTELAYARHGRLP